MILAITGFTASGKDTLATELAKYFRLVKPTTSRPRRDGEIDTYHFISSDQFKSDVEQEKFLEYRAYDVNYRGVKDTWYYGTSYKELSDDINIVITDIDGLKSFKNSDYIVKSLFLDVDISLRLERCKSRGDFDVVEFSRRLKDDLVKYPSEVVSSEVDVILVNPTIEEAVEAAMDLVCE